MKKLLFLLPLAAIVLFFAFGAHTYFIQQRVDEDLIEGARPTTSSSEEPSTLQESVLEELARGELTKIDAIHGGTGVVRLLQPADMDPYLRFEDVSITNGPDLFVYVSDQPQPGNTVASLGTYVDLGRLKGNQGNQNYPLPALDFEPQSVVVWCKRFGVLFTYATLAK